MCSGPLLQLICNYIIFMVLTFGCIVGIVVFDSYLKSVQAKNEPALQSSYASEKTTGLMGWLGSNPDYT